MNKWKMLYRCWLCEHDLSWNEVMTRHGVCPYCGGKSDSPIARHSQHSVKFVRDYPRWKFWRRKGRLIFK